MGIDTYNSNIVFKKINAPKNDIETITQHIIERKVAEMFSLMGKYDVQETRRHALQEGRQEGLREAQVHYIIKLLRMKFKELPSFYETKIKMLPSESLEQIIDSIFEINHLNDLEQYFTV